MDVQEFQRIKSKVETARREFDKAQGVLSEHLRRLKNDFGCDTLEDAESKLKSLEKKLKSKTSIYEESLATFKDKWSDEIDF